MTAINSFDTWKHSEICRYTEKSIQDIEQRHKKANDAPYTFLGKEIDHKVLAEASVEGLDKTFAQAMKVRKIGLIALGASLGLLATAIAAGPVLATVIVTIAYVGSVLAAIAAVIGIIWTNRLFGNEAGPKLEILARRHIVAAQRQVDEGIAKLAGAEKEKFALKVAKHFREVGNTEKALEKLQLPAEN